MTTNEPAWNRQALRFSVRMCDAALMGRGPFFVAGGYLALLGGWRAFEVLPLVSGFRVEGEPDWLLPYLAVITSLVAGAGVALVVTGLTLPTRPKLAGIVGRVGAALLGAFIAAHAVFLIAYEDAFADGGIIWGFIHTLTLTRLPTTGTPAGILGYRIGSAIGMAAWFVGAFVMLGMTVLATRAPDAAPRD